MTFHINPSDPTPLYAQLERAIRLGIATGRLQPDTQLPTVRQLAVDLRINANTVAKVYRDLERAGLVETRRGVGTFIKAPPPAAMPVKERERLLRSLADRFMAEVAMQGFSVDELLIHIKGRLSKGE
ncbi:MAG: GntR family transcriptional regulator [Acidobacteriia bacterium]|nr:GntR family transcriptional regulator [Terriglobia bacterium]